MMDLKIKDTDASIAVNEAVFDYQYNEDLIHQAVTTYMNNARSGNSAQKTRSEVRGGGRKPFNQKGGGRARAGTIRSPIWRGGGVTFASKKRDYSQKLNKKMYIRAIRSIISELNRREDLIVVDDFSCDSHKTKDFVKKMETLNITNALIVMDEVTENVYLGARNLHQYGLCDSLSIDPVSLLQFDKVLITREAVKNLEELLQ